MNSLASDSGILLIDKPSGLTSQDCLTSLKKAGLHHAKLGHAGTLDPFATGLLIVLINDATRLSDLFLHGDKVYSGLAQFGTQTATADWTGETIAQTPHRPLRHDLDHIVRHWNQSSYVQVAPNYSAKKMDGTKLVDRARRGQALPDELRPRDARTIHAFSWLTPDSAADTPTTPSLALDSASFRAHTSSGTYIRTLMEDIATGLGTLANLKSLCREMSGEFSLQDASPLSSACDWIAQANKASSSSWSLFPSFRTVEQALRHLPRMSLSEAQCTALYQGRSSVEHYLLRSYDELQHAHPHMSEWCRVETTHEIVALCRQAPQAEHFEIRRIRFPKPPRLRVQTS